MKKKIALLVALVMMLSMIPAHLFGFVVSPPARSNVGQGEPINFNVIFDYNLFGGIVDGTTSSALFELVGGNDETRWQATFATGQTISPGSGLSVPAEIIFERVNNRTLRVELVWKDDIPANPEGNFTIEDLLNAVIAGDAGARVELRVTPIEFWGGEVTTRLIGQRLANFGASVSIAGVRVASSEDGVRINLDQLRIAESFPGSLTNVRAMEHEGDTADRALGIILRAPQFYTWAGTPTIGSARGFIQLSSSSGAFTRLDRWDGRDTIFIPLANITRTSTGFGNDTLNIDGLVLVADELARPIDDNIAIDVRVNTPNFLMGGEWMTWGLKVAERAHDAINSSAGDPVGVWSGRTSDWTATISLRETSIGTWNANNDIRLEVPDGIRITAVEARSPNESFAGNMHANDFRGIGGLDINPRNNNFVTFSIPGGDVNRLKQLDLRLRFSVEPGYTGDIPVTVSGRGVDGFISNDTLVVATASSPFSVEFVGVSRVDTGSFVDIHIDEIRITEAAPSMFNTNQEIWLYAVDGNVREDFSINVPTGRGTITTEGSRGQIVSRDRIDETFNASVRRNLLSVRIDRQGFDDPATVTIRDVNLSGNARAGAQVLMAISGSAIAPNHAYVEADRISTPGDIKNPTTELRLSTWLFDTPYLFEIAETVPEPEDPDEGEEPGEGEPGDPGDGPPEEVGLINPDILNTYFWSDGDNFGAYPNVFRMHQFEGYEMATSMVMASALAWALGLVPSWDAATATGTWTGYNARDEYVIIELVNGSSIMNVSFDGGAFIPETLTAAVGEVPAIIIGENFFVPIAAFQDVLGITVTWIPGEPGERGVFIN
jgi:hypothetical protein